MIPFLGLKSNRSTYGSFHVSFQPGLVLSGENSRITSENNLISGEKIIMYRNDGRIIVESGENKGRVEAVISSAGSGLK